MPNYCNNCLSIEGNYITLKKIIDFVKSEETAFDFEKIVPMPDYVYRGAVGTKEKEIYGENNWYDWSIKNWGTKWNSEDAEVDGNEIQFLTAWSPCDPVIAALAKMYPTMRFTHTFYETGMCFCGKRVYENGKIVFSYDGDYAVNYECEDDECEYTLTDSMFPIKKSGFTEEVEEVKSLGIGVIGRLHFREYMNNRIYQKTDGVFIATEDYASRFIGEQDIPVLQAA